VDGNVGGSQVEPVAVSAAEQTAGRLTTDRPAKPSRRPDSRRNMFRLFYSVPAVVLLVLLVAPLVLMAGLSLRDDLSGPILQPWSPTLVHYGEIADSPSFLRLLGTSIVMAGIVSLATTILAYPLAYFLRFQAGSRAGLYLFLLLLPFWTSYLLRVFAWRLMLGPTGVVNSLLEGAGLISQPLDALLYNRTAVMVTLAYVWIPFSAIPILAGLQRVDPSLHEAAADLYAQPMARFLRVTLPLSMPGVVIAFFICFIPTVGEYVTPLLVGGTSGIMYGNIIQELFIRAANWTLGSALAIVMLVATLVLAAVALRLVDVRRFVPR
jgi:spermidine/putrescine transport system permease protein